MTTLEHIRASFNGDSVHEKDVALRMAHDEIAAMDAEIRRLREQNNDLTMKGQDYVENIEELKEMLDERDAFIRIRGLWENYEAWT